ncbi:hypothetical protein F4776DRAFT_604098 [Hypoxylon sp. NC0597]|nr:hypothetical protein F4776DRAFT_604098 [Hypoxylon sp. NC0597]
MVKYCVYVAGYRTLTRDFQELGSVYIILFRLGWLHLYIGNSFSFPSPLFLLRWPICQLLQ